MAEQNEACGGLCASPAVIGLALAAALVVPVAGFFAARLVGGAPGSDLGEEAALKRIQPMAQVSLAGSAGGTKAARGSEEIYKATCAACHDAGVAGAPKTGDKAAWAARIGGGLEKLAASGIKGKGAMPPKGGADLSDADFTRVVAWLANKSGAGFKEPPASKAPAPAAAPAVAPAVVAAPAADEKGKKVYGASCAACHASGVAGAPKLGDKAAWGPRLGGGLDALTASAIKGKGAMPPKGGNTSIPDADIRAAVEYMAGAAK
ncbi:MAG: cytochrome c5 family protein [Zoogloeaceae bacterium]|nr:cytochrome c5 family protein [Zoogloeaceae bacterium]MCK6384577.1 c-type cytochrome [Rhodocyclaceae bacterium]